MPDDNPIRRARKAKGLSQEELARRAELSLSTIYAADHSGASAISEESVMKIADALGVKREELAPQVFVITAGEALGAQLAVRAANTAGQLAQAGGYEIADPARLSRRLREATFALAELVLEHRRDATDEELDAWADELAARVLREVHGRAPEAH